jgi:two-component system, NtrC family, sensor histidine kinase HydH
LAKTRMEKGFPVEMNTPSASHESDLRQKTKWLILGRFLFAVLLSGSTAVSQLSGTIFYPVKPIMLLGLLITGLFLVTLIYFLLWRTQCCETGLAYTQILVDTFFVSAVINVTGGFFSIFSFLYLVVIIYASILLFRLGSFLTAACCSLQYAAMMFLEYRGILVPIAVGQDSHLTDYSTEQVLFQVLITIAVCFAVAFLSSILAEQAKRSKDELLEMEQHVKRVEKMAYMGKMAANLAHEIKNPLASIAGALQLLKEEMAYDPDHDKLMQIALRETRRLSAMVGNFLLFSRPGTGKPETIELSRALTEIVDVFEKNNDFSDRIVVQSEFSTNIHVRIDPDHLKQVVMNLLLNAAEAVAVKGMIQLKMHPAKNNFAEITVSDNGCGISKDMMNSIFDPFFTTKPKGTGLGLSIVLNLLEAYDSRLEVESVPDQGTQIRFRLKRVDG